LRAAAANAPKELDDNLFVTSAQEENCMKKLLLSAVAFAALVAAPVAMADPNGPNDNQPKQDRPDKADRQNNDQNGGPGSNAMQGPAAQDNSQPRDRNMPDRNPNATPDRDNRVSTPGNDNDNRVVNKTVVNKTVVRKTVNRTEVLKVRANIQAPRRFHITVAYRQPAGFYVHRWTFGERLPVAFYAQDYWLSDFALYGLMAPWAGYEWVRVGDDALLVDVETGEVVRVEYGLFY
jgi:Ni/Co efflux regulator RcnB